MTKQDLNTTSVSNDVHQVIQPSAFTPSGEEVIDKKRSLSFAKWLMIIVLSILAVIIWFLVTAKSVKVDTNPIADSVKISGGLQFQIGDNYLMREGDYTFTASAKGYYPLEQSFTVGEAQNQQLSLAFNPLPGMLTVNVNDGIQADIEIAGINGRSGEQLTEIPAGTHTLSISAKRYKAQTTSITIEGKEVAQTLSVELVPDWADVQFTSSPAGADIVVDGNVIGKTPDTVEVLSGVKNIELKLQGFKNWQTELSVIAQNSVVIPEVFLEKLDGGIVLSSSPAGATVTIDQKYVGTTPLNLPLQPKADYKLKLFKDGYQPKETTFTVNSEQIVDLALNLDPLLAKVAVNATPKGALLYVNDVLMGRANQTITLTEKQHAIRVEKDGYVAFKTTVLPKSGESQSVQVALKTLEQAKWENIKYNIDSYAGTNLKLFIPKDVEFTMGASRREQGRRANEAQRRVAITKPFYISTHEVTNKEYRMFVRQHTSGHVSGNSLNSDGYPVVKVSWQQAAKYCNWLSKKEGLPAFYIEENGEIVGFDKSSVGYRLPFESEWAWLARFKRKSTGKYAWGNQLPPAEGAGNLGDRSGAPLLGQIQVKYNDSYVATAPIKSFAADENGLFDLSGNVAEWLTDFYEIKTGLSLKIEKDPTGPEKGQYHVIRGTSWRHGSMTELRLAFRDYGDEARDDVGFRIARYVD